MDKYTSRIMAWQLRNPLLSDFTLDDLDGPSGSAPSQPHSLQELCLHRVAVACQDLTDELPPLLRELLLAHACREGLLSPVILSACLEDRLELSDFGSRGFSVSAAVRHVASMAPPPVLLQTVLLSWCYGFEASALLMLLAAVGGQLRVLHLWKCGYVDDVCARAVAASCPLLEDVDLRGCKQLTTAARVEVLKACTKLERVRLGESHNDHTVTAAGKLPRLRVLELPQSDDISCMGALHLQSCGELVFLNLTRANVGRRSLAAIAAGCPRLSSLALDRCQHVDDRALAELRLLTGLRDLSVANTKVSERSLVELPRLRRLKVNGCRCTALPAQCVPTEVLEMSGCPELKDVALAQAGGTLRVLDLSMTPLSSESVAGLPAACANVRCLVLKEVDWLLPEILDRVVARCHGTLQHLDVDQSEPIQGYENNGSAIAGLSRCTQLETLMVTGHGVGSDAIRQVLRSCPKLMSINAYCPDLISEGQFAALNSSPSALGLRALRERFTQFSFRTISSDGVGILIHRERPNDAETDYVAIHRDAGGLEEAIRRAIFLAQTAEAAERYVEMSRYMREVCVTVPELNAEGRKLLYLAFKKKVGAFRTHWLVADHAADAAQESGNDVEAAFARERQTELEGRIVGVAGEVFAILDRLESLASTDEAMIFYMKMRADYNRYVAETRRGVNRTAAAQVADASYAEALTRARLALRTGHATLLGVALNYAVFMREVCADRDGACLLCRTTLAGAAQEFGTYPDEEAATVLQLLKDNLAQWTSELADEAQAAGALASGGASALGDLMVVEADEADEL